MNENIVAIVERTEDGNIYHISDEPWDDSAWYQTIRCGGGIILPYREEVPISQICKDCLEV